MRLLLDSHTFLWFVANDPRLSETARVCLLGAAELYLSIASVWELGIKAGLGKLALARPIEEFVQVHASASQIAILPISVHHVGIVSALPLHHRDPFDRMIVAQCAAEQLELVSGDEALDGYGLIRIW